MPRNYTQKNSYFKNSRLDIEQTKSLVLMYLKGVKASYCAEILGVSSGSISELYKKLDRIIWDGRLFLDVTRYLDDENQDILKNLLYVIYGLITNLNRRPETQREEWELECIAMNKNYAFCFGDGEFYPKSNQFKACINTCDSGTPPLVTRQMIDAGKLNLVREKRFSCKTCPIRLKELYEPRRAIYYPLNMNSETNMVYEPNTKFYGDSRDIIIFWVDVLWFLGHHRRVGKFNYFIKSIHAMYFAALKRCEYKTSQNIIGGIGIDVPVPFLYPDQKVDVEKGIRFTSTLDVPMLNFFLEAILRSKEPL